MNPFAIVQADSRLLLPLLVALTFGAIMVPSAGVIQGDTLWLKHLVYLTVSGVVFALAVLVPTRYWQGLQGGALVLALVLCGLALLPGLGREVNGARRWLDLGLFTVQGGELAKLLLLVYLAGFLARHGERVADLRHQLLEPLLAYVALAALLLFAPDFGTVVVLGILLLGLLFVAGVPLRVFALLTAGAILLGAVVAVWQPYRVARITAFIDPWGDAFGGAYQLTQSLIAFGRGGVTGVGLGEGVQKLHYLPESHNDFIFAVIVEELGLLGGLILMTAFCCLVWRLLTLARQALRQDFWFGGYLLYGVALLLGGQFLINVGVSSGTLPTKGLSLPLVSYGGNALVVTAVLLALACRTQYELGADLLAPRERRAAFRATAPRERRQRGTTARRPGGTKATKAVGRHRDR